LEGNLRQLLPECTAGDPRRAGVLWTHLSLRELSRRLMALGPPARRRTIRRRRRKLPLGRRTARKKTTMGHHPERHAPCANLARLRREYEAAGDAVSSLDTKKNELRGHFHRTGTTVPAETVETFDHDFGSAGEGQLIRHGVSALMTHHAHIHRNTRHATSAWCGDRVAWWWEQAGRTAHPLAPRLLRLGDGGGSNSATHSLCQADLPGLANRLGLAMRGAHEPPDGSKHKPIEHQGFPHITGAGQGVIFHTVDMARQFIARTKTATGRRVTVRTLDKGYQTGRKYAADFKQNMKILFDEHLPKWNYRAVPACTCNRELIFGHILSSTLSNYAA
jgi:hypothetical protein